MKTFQEAADGGEVVVGEEGVDGEEGVVGSETGALELPGGMAGGGFDFVFLDANKKQVVLRRWCSVAS